MADQGWAYNMADDLWELLDKYGLRCGAVTAEMIVRCGAARVNRAGEAKGWPELVPGSPWWHLILLGGPADGHHEYIHPGEAEEPPARLAVTLPQAEMVAVGDMPVSGDAFPVGYYRRQIQVCGHGRACPYPYSFDRGLW